MSAEELDFIKSDRPSNEVGPEKGAWKIALKNRNILLLTISYFCSNYVFYLFFNGFFYYLVDVKGFSAADAGMLTAALWILGAVGATAGGFICDLVVRRLGIRLGPRYMTMTALILSAIFLYFGAVSDNVVITVTMLCICFAFNQLTEAPFWVATMAVSGRHAAITTGILNTGGNLPGIIGAVLWLFVRADEPMDAA